MIDQSAAFNGRTIAWVVIASIIAAAGFFVLSTYAPRFHPASGAGTVYDTGGTGFAGLNRLLILVGRPPGIVEDNEAFDDPGLLIVPLDPDLDPATLKLIQARRRDKPILYVLPKWATLPMPRRPGWVYRGGRLPDPALTMLVKQVANTSVGGGGDITVDGCAIRQAQWVADPDPVVAAAPGKALLAKEDGAPHWVLADPDVMNNAGLADPACMRATLALIAGLDPRRAPVTIVGQIGSPASKSLSRLVLEPPFLALTLTILVAAALAFGQGFVRFGPARGEVRAIAFGKRALVDITARLLRRGGKLGGLGERYAQLLRARAAALLGAPAGLDDSALDTWLDARDAADAHAFSARAEALRSASSAAEMRAARRRCTSG